MIEWKEIPTLKDYYISTDGKIKNKKGQILKTHISKNGYEILTITKGSRKDNSRKTINKRVHRLVLETFKPIENSELYDVNHINRNKADNRLENLEWCTRSENLYWKEKPDSIGRSSKIVKVQYLNGTTEYYNSLTECAKHFNVCIETIRGYMIKKLSPRRKIQACFSYVNNFSEQEKGESPFLFNVM